MKKIEKITVIIALGLILVTAYSMLSNRGIGVIEGKVTIGPFSPVEPSMGPTVPPGTYSSRVILLKPWIGETISIPLNEDGSFHAEVRAGKYEASLSDCVFLGCANSLPRQVEIRQGETTILNIEIDTGIR